LKAAGHGALAPVRLFWIMSGPRAESKVKKSARPGKEQSPEKRQIQKRFAKAKGDCIHSYNLI